MLLRYFELFLDFGAMNIVIAYAPQIGCCESEKENFREALDQVLQSISAAEKIVIDS